MIGYLFLTIALCAGAAYTVGYRTARSFAAAPGDLHSLPSYHGAFVAIWVGVPALVLVLLWLSLQGNVLDGQVNVTTRERQPGSALKPFTYLSAMQQGMTPASVLWDVPTEFPPFGPDSYKPENYNGKWNGPIRIRTALANSLNMPAVKALKYAGVQNTLDLLHRAGITGLQNPPDYYGLALTLGGGEVTPLDLTAAYNTLASGGTYYKPMAITKIVHGRGQTREFAPEPHPDAINPDHVAIVIHNYRWRLGLAEGEAKYDALEDTLAKLPPVEVPTITIEGDANGAPHPDPASYATRFKARYEHRTFTGGVGHNVPQEAPAEFAKAVIDVDHF